MIGVHYRAAGQRHDTDVERGEIVAWCERMEQAYPDFHILRAEAHRATPGFEGVPVHYELRGN